MDVQRSVRLLARICLGLCAVLLWVQCWPAAAADPQRAIFALGSVHALILGMRLVPSRRSVAGRIGRPVPASAATALARYAPAAVAQMEDIGPDAARRAHHEAAHAVIAITCGIRVDYATIRPETSPSGLASGGHTRLQGGCTGAPPEEVAWGHLVATLAGHVVDVAGGHHDLCSVDDWRVAHLRAQDLASIGRLPDGICAGPTPDELLRAGLITARTVVAESEHWISAVAAALEVRTTLTGTQIEELAASGDRRSDVELAAAGEGCVPW